MSQPRIPDPTLMARLQLSVKGVDWAASLVAPWQHLKIEGEWSPHEHVYHLIGNERVFQERIARILAEERPVLERWDSEGYMATHTGDEDIDVLAEAFMRAREQTANTFKELTPTQWARTGTWPDGREVDLAWLAEKCLWHALDHFVFLLDFHGEVDARQAQRWLGATT